MHSKAPLIIGFVADLMFSSRIEMVAQHLEYQVKWVSSVAELVGAGPSEVETAVTEPASHKPGEQLQGIEGILFEKITAWQPALILFDLANDAIPWQRWIPLLKSSAATRRLPIVAYGPHVDSERLQKAKEGGADAVMPRSRFSAKMLQVFQDNTVIPDEDALTGFCREPLPELVKRGIDLFNQGEYYKCHDDLEEAWRQDQTAGRDLYQAVLQVGIAYYQIERGNYRGAVKMLLRVRQWLAPLPAICRGVDVEKLRGDVTAVYTTLTQLGPDQITNFDSNLFQPIIIVST